MGYTAAHEICEIRQPAASGNCENFCDESKNRQQGTRTCAHFASRHWHVHGPLITRRGAGVLAAPGAAAAGGKFRER